MLPRMASQIGSLGTDKQFGMAASINSGSDESHLHQIAVIFQSPNLRTNWGQRKKHHKSRIGPASLYWMASSQPDEERFKAHIRQLLFRYAKTYLTVDYVEWTEKAVLELLQQYLRDVPVDDPVSLWLPQDPFDMLARLYDLSNVTAYEERWQTNPHALALIKESLAGFSGKTRSEKAPFFDNYDMHYTERLSPILTMRAIRDTHKFSSQPKAVATQRTPFLVTERISELQVGDEETPLQMERILNVMWGIHSTIREEVRGLLSGALNLPARDISRCRAWSNFEDGCNTQPSCIERPEWPFVPLFPRNRRLGCQTIGGAQTGKLDYFAELQKNILPQIPTEILELNLFNGDMCVIDSWGAFQISSPSTLATLTSSQEDREIDHLFIGSSPNSDPYPIETLEATKMENIQMPRSRRLGGIPECTKSITHGHSFTSFILQQLPEIKGPETSNITPRSLLQECTSSLAGQASSSSLHEALGLLYEDDDRALRSLYASVDPKDLWHGETLDEKNMMLMEVPTLPPPNNHAPGPLFLPSSFSDFVPASGEQGAAIHQFLGKVKGLQPLRVGLSWMAFTTNEPLPTDAQIIETTCCFRESELLMKGIPIGAIRELIDGIAPGMEGRQCDMTAMQMDPRLFGDPTSPAIGRFVDYVPDIILIGRGRWQRVGKFDSELEPAEMSSDIIFVEPRLENYSRPTKKLKPYQIRQTSVVNVSPNSLDFGCAKDKLTDFSTDSAANNHTKKDSNITQPSSYPSFVPENAPDTSTALPRLFNDKITTTGIRNLGFILPTTACHEVKVSTYARLRLKTVSAPNISTEDPSGYPDSFIPAEEGVIRTREIPADIFNHSTLQLPPYIKETATCHRYMASIDVLQKQAFVRLLATPRYSVQLVERDDLGSANLIVDPFTGVIYASLFSLPSECEVLISRISKLSWIYRRLIVMLEGYPPAAAIKALDETSTSLFAYTPPILKAIKRFRRGVDMTEAVGEKCETTIVLYAFPNTVDEAAAITRHIGDLAEDADQTNGAVWGNRMWMDEVTEDEEVLAKAAGMNRFTAALILSQVTLEDFVEMTAEQRQDTFGNYVGDEAIMAFNADLKAHTEIDRSDNAGFQDYDHAIDAHGSGTTDDFDMDTYA